MKKKLLSFIFILGIILPCGLFFGGCGKHSHSWVSDENYHWYTCTECKNETQKKKHEFEYDRWDSTTNKQVYKCEICGFEIKHVHSYIPKRDNYAHWEECEICDMETSHIAHELEFNHYDEYIQDDIYECDECGYEEVRTHQHDATILHNEAQHYEYCEICDTEINHEDHSFENLTIENGKTTGTCSTCDYEIKDVESMNFILCFIKMIYDKTDDMAFCRYPLNSESLNVQP